MSEAEVRELLRTRVEALGGPVSWARRHAVSGVYLRDVLSGRRSPGPAILAPLGLQRVEAEADYQPVAANSDVAEEAANG